ncbi:MAG: ankyrin repeat domain-containing protein [Sulfuritalea sp.]|jgi:hypothetical protein|nr:ankyrin repeat domain-containing protein [Sulfuritalea sp.]
MDIVRQKQIREWTLVGLVGAMALVANLPSKVLDSIGVDVGLLMAILGLMVVIALFLYVRFFFFLLYALLAVGANLPGKLAEELGISQGPMLAALVIMVAISLLNYGAKLMPSGLEAKKRTQNPEATRVLLNAIERGNLPYVKTVLAMDFDLDTFDSQGMSPLMHAAQRGEFKIVQRLIQRGASSLLVGPSGKASDVALQNNFPAVNEFLKRVEEVQAAEAARRATAEPKGASVAAA